MTEYHAHIPDINQNFWQLACIQSASMGLPGMLVGGKIAREYGAGTAISSICIGNLILWGIAYIIVAMSLSSRGNAIENIKKYIGVWPCILGALILAISFLSWTMEQNSIFIEAMQSITKWDISQQTHIGTLTLTFVALLSVGSIQLIKKICTYAMPFLLLFVIYHSISSYTSYRAIIDTSWSVSSTAILAIIMQGLAGAVNLPTFFRHARSKHDGFLALTLMTGLVSLFETFCVVTNLANPAEFFDRVLPQDVSVFIYSISIGFITIAMICANLVNIYFASAGWEAISNILKSASSKWSLLFRRFLSYILIPHNSKYSMALGILCLAIGIASVVVYQIIRSIGHIEFLESISDNILSTLSIVLMLAFLTKIIEKHEARIPEKAASSLCWFVGCFTVIYTQIKNPQNSDEALFAGIFASFIVFLGIVFFEATYYAMNGLLNNKINQR